MGHFSSHLNQEKSDLAEIVLGRRDGNGKGSAAPQVESPPKSPTHSFLIPYTSSLGDREPSCSVLILQHLSHSLQLLNSFPKGGGYNYCSTNSRARNTSLLSLSEMTVHWSLSPSAAGPAGSSVSDDPGTDSVVPRLVQRYCGHLGEAHHRWSSLVCPESPVLWASQPLQG